MGGLGSSGGGAGGGGGRGRSFQGPPGFSMESHSHFLSMPALHGVASRSRPAYPGTGWFKTLILIKFIPIMFIQHFFLFLYTH